MAMYNPYLSAAYGYPPDPRQFYGQPPYDQPGQLGQPQPGTSAAGTAPAPAPQQRGPDWVMVQTINQVEQINVPAGAKAWIMVQNEPIFALRTADQMGLVQTDYYRFEHIDPAAAAPAQQADYITRDELEARLTELVGTLKPQPARPKKEAAE